MAILVPTAFLPALGPFAARAESVENEKNDSRYVDIDPKYFTILTNAQCLDTLFRQRIGISGMLTQRFNDFLEKIGTRRSQSRPGTRDSPVFPTAILQQIANQPLSSLSRAMSEFVAIDLSGKRHRLDSLDVTPQIVLSCKSVLSSPARSPAPISTG